MKRRVHRVGLASIVGLLVTLSAAVSVTADGRYRALWERELAASLRAG